MKTSCYFGGCRCANYGSGVPNFPILRLQLLPAILSRTETWRRPHFQGKTCAATPGRAAVYGRTRSDYQDQTRFVVITSCASHRRTYFSTLGGTIEGMGRALPRTLKASFITFDLPQAVFTIQPTCGPMRWSRVRVYSQCKGI
jgi:hypothetical protein